MVAVVAHQIGDWRARDRRGKDAVRVRRKKCSIEPAPAVSDDADARGIDDAHLRDALHASGHAIDDRFPRLPRLKDDVGLKNELALTGEHRCVVVIPI